MRVIFSTLAKQELEDAARYYELELEGLGKRFKGEIKRAARRIARYPQAWSIERGEIRKCPLHKFPYKLPYSIEKDHIFINSCGPSTPKTRLLDRKG